MRIPLITSPTYSVLDLWPLYPSRVRCCSLISTSNIARSINYPMMEFMSISTVIGRVVTIFAIVIWSWFITVDAARRFFLVVLVFLCIILGFRWRIILVIRKLTRFLLLLPRRLPLFSKLQRIICVLLDSSGPRCFCELSIN